MTVSRGESRYRHSGQSDECPFHRPFPSEFDDCPAYLPTEYIGMNLHHEPLPPVWSCENLEVAQRADRPGAHYGRCRLGTAEQRVDWVREVERHGLGGILAIRREYNREFHDLKVALWEAKGRTLHDPSDQTARLQLEASAALFKLACERFFRARSASLDEAGLTVEAALGLVGGMVDRLVQGRTLQPAANLSEAELSEFPSALRFFLQPGSVARPPQ